MQIQLLLHNIRSARNVGAIFRSADAFGIERVWCTGYTPTPLDRHGRTRSDTAKTALGAQDRVEWYARTDPRTVIQQVRADGYTVAAVEQGKTATPMPTWRPPNAVCLVFGNEVRGISRSLQSRTDVLVEIPLIGEKESLNVSVAAGISMYHCVTAGRVTATSS